MHWYGRLVPSLDTTLDHENAPPSTHRIGQIADNGSEGGATLDTIPNVGDRRRERSNLRCEHGGSRFR